MVSMRAVGRCARIFVAGAVGLMLLGDAPGASAGEPAETGTAPAGAAGLRIYRDPVPDDGPPSARGVVPPPAPGHSTSGAGLVEAPGRSRAGGVGLHLQGRFRRAVRETVDPAGAVHADCVPGAVPGKE